MPGKINRALVRLLIFTGLTGSFFFASSQVTKQVSLAINTRNITGHVDHKIYGQLLEHIYHSINGGLWGEMIASRSFEPVAYKGWYIENGQLFSPATRTGELSISKPRVQDFEAGMDLAWKPWFVGVPAPWSGGKSNMRFVFRESDDGQVCYSFHMNAISSGAFTLEKGSKKQDGKYEWSVIRYAGTLSPAYIDPKQWHHLRIRCEGPVVTISWDNKKIIDYNKLDCYQASLILSTSQTSGRYRHIYIKTLTGKSLEEGFPEQVMPPAVAPDWSSFGDGRFQVVNNARNRYYAQKISADKEEAGVSQGPMHIIKGMAYRGYVWAKGDGKASLSVRLHQEGNPLAIQRLGVPGTTWKEYKFELSPVASSDKAIFSLVIKGGSVVVDQASMMSDTARNTGGYRPDLYAASTGIAPTTLRWPGGSFASGYNWKWGIGPQVNRIRMPKAGWDDYEQNAFGTDEFIDLCRRMHAEPVIVIPIGYDQPDTERIRLIRQACEWIAYCNEPASGTWGKLRAKNGHREPYHVKYWEIDNEMWEMGVEKYSSILRQFVPELKKTDPSIKIIACGDFTQNNVYRDSVLLFSSGKYLDYISLHHYESPANYAKGPLSSALKYAEVSRLIAASPNPSARIYVSEWNASELDWRTGLYAAGILNVFEKEPAVEMAAAALFLRRTDASGWNNAFINFDYKGWFAAPNYVVTKLFREHYAPLRIETTGAADSLNLLATMSEDGRYVYFKAVNPASYPVSVKLTVDKNFPVSTPLLQLVTASSLSDKNSMERPDLIKPVNAEILHVHNDLTFTLPRLSVGVLTIQKL